MAAKMMLENGLDPMFRTGPDEPFSVTYLVSGAAGPDDVYKALPEHVGLGKPYKDS